MNYAASYNINGMVKPLSSMYSIMSVHLCLTLGSYSAIHPAARLCATGKNGLQRVDIFLFHWNGTSQSWEI